MFAQVTVPLPFGTMQMCTTVKSFSYVQEFIIKPVVILH